MPKHVCELLFIFISVVVCGWSFRGMFKYTINELLMYIGVQMRTTKPTVLRITYFGLSLYIHMYEFCTL